MHDKLSSSPMDSSEDPVDLKSAIALIQDGKASEALTVDLGGGVIARADGRFGLQGLLQRLRGYRLILSLANADAPGEVVSMRSGSPEVHPDVSEILDALKR